MLGTATRPGHGRGAPHHGAVRGVHPARRTKTAYPNAKSSAAPSATSPGRPTTQTSPNGPCLNVDLWRRGLDGLCEHRTTARGVSERPGHRAGGMLEGRGRGPTVHPLDAKPPRRLRNGLLGINPSPSRSLPRRQVDDRCCSYEEADLRGSRSARSPVMHSGPRPRVRGRPRSVDSFDPRATLTTACEQTRLCCLGGFGKDRSSCLGEFLGTDGLCDTML